jgi:hypothetical protein
MEREIEELIKRAAGLAATLASLNSEGHPTPNAYKELERIRGRLDVLKRIVGQQT